MSVRHKSSLLALAMILVGLATVFTTSANAVTVCYKPGYNVAIREHPWFTAKKLGTSPAEVTVNVRSDGWAKFRKGFIFTGPPNVTACQMASTAPKTSKSLPSEPKTSGFKFPSIPNPTKVLSVLKRYVRDVQIAKKAQGQLPLVQFCEKHRSGFAWTKCFAESDKLAVHTARLVSTNTNAPARAQARGYIANFLSRDIVRLTSARLDALIDEASTGLPNGFWSSKKLKKLNNRAESLADSSKIKHLELFVTSALPALTADAKVLKNQHPKFDMATKPFRPLISGVSLSDLDKKLITKGVNGLTLEENAVFTDYPQKPGFDRWFKKKETSLPLTEAQFTELLATIPGKVHDLTFESLRMESQITIEAYAKNRGLEKYLEEAKTYSLQINVAKNDQSTVVHPCDVRFKAKAIVACKDAVTKILEVEIARTAYTEAFTAFRKLPISATVDEFKQYHGQVAHVFRTKVEELTAPKAGWGTTAKLFVLEYRFWLAGSLLLACLLFYVWPFGRRSQKTAVRSSKTQRTGTGWF